MHFPLSLSLSLSLHKISNFAHSSSNIALTPPYIHNVWYPHRHIQSSPTTLIYNMASSSSSSCFPPLIKRKHIMSIESSSSSLCLLQNNGSTINDETKESFQNASRSIKSSSSSSSCHLQSNRSMMNDEATESIQNVSKSIKYSSSSSHVNNLSMCKMNTDSIMIASKTLGLNISELSVQCVVACSSSRSSSQKTMYQSSSRTKHNTSSIESIISKDVENVDGDAFVSFNLLCRQECERICKVLSSHKDLEPIRKMKKSYRVCDRM